MTVGKLHKILTRMIAEGHGRKRVCVNKETFSHPLECDGAVILDVADASVQSFPMLDGDGFKKLRSDGTECFHTALVIAGDSDPNEASC